MHSDDKKRSSFVALLFVAGDLQRWTVLKKRNSALEMKRLVNFFYEGVVMSSPMVVVPRVFVLVLVGLVTGRIWGQDLGTLLTNYTKTTTIVSVYFQ
jgi:hypothetical protein